ncbi:MAG: FAD-dependent oxidoreductase [Candidatus Hydrogenedentes bacterium]|nr:FAD-dependent oxidoreductase [Candidatus Hydrogenedentota bacterium]
MERRTFLLQGLGLAAAGLSAVGAEVKTVSKRDTADGSSVIIIGGGLGGCAAALSAAVRGRKVILTEETDWIGGQSTVQAVPPDENPWIETYGGTRLYRQYRDRIRAYYRKNYPMTNEARARERLNPGNGGVSAICHEPRVSVAALQEMLAPYIQSGHITLRLRTKAVSVDFAGDHVKAVHVRDLESGAEETLEGAFFLDATELGDLLPMARAEYVSGAESKAQTGELHAAAEAQPHNMQAISWCFAMDYLEGEDHTIEKPKDYDFWKSYTPKLNPPWPGRLLDWQYTHPVTLKPNARAFDPLGKTAKEMGAWNFRRILDRANFVEGAYKSDITLVNWPQIDYWLGNVCVAPEDDVKRHLDGAKQLSLSWLYWMQTEAPRLDGKPGWPGLRLRKDVVDTKDGLAKAPYIRESRRIKAEFTVLEQHVGRDARAQITGKPAKEVVAELFPDSVGIGYYRIDLHPSTGGDNYIDVDSTPFQIPLGALIPQRIENLLPACKNLGVTHITNGCYRLHPVEWNIGESAGALAAFCLERNAVPRAVRDTPGLLRDFQQSLQQQGINLAWPAEALAPKA